MVGPSKQRPVWVWEGQTHTQERCAVQPGQHSVLPKARGPPGPCCGCRHTALHIEQVLQDGQFELLGLLILCPAGHVLWRIFSLRYLNTGWGVQPPAGTPWVWVDETVEQPGHLCHQLKAHTHPRAGIRHRRQAHVTPVSISWFSSDRPSPRAVCDGSQAEDAGLGGPMDSGLTSTTPPGSSRRGHLEVPCPESLPCHRSPALPRYALKNQPEWPTRSQ